MQTLLQFLVPCFLVYVVIASLVFLVDLFEIIFLCAEAVILSIIGEIYAIQGIGVFLFVFFEETAIFFLNYIVKYIASVFFGEAEENYY